MVAWVVIDRQQPRQAGPFASLLSTPVIPLPHLSPLLPTPYGHSYTTATHQPLCNQFVTHSFHRDGGCTTPLLGASTAYALLPIHYLLSFQIRAHSFAFLCTFLRLPKTQLISFQANSLSTISFLFKYVRTLLHFFALFCAYQKLNSFLFKRFRTPCKKPRGWGWGHESPLSPIGFPPLHPIKSPRCPHPAGKWTGQSRNHYE